MALIIRVSFRGVRLFRRSPPETSAASGGIITIIRVINS